MDKNRKEALAALGCLVAAGAMGYHNLKMYSEHAKENPDSKVVDCIVGGISTAGLVGIGAGLTAKICDAVLGTELMVDKKPE